jgi:hypothetical protein
MTDPAPVAPDPRSTLQKLLVKALLSEHADECFTALQMAKRAMANKGHGDMHVLARHIENIGRQIIPTGYASPQEVDRVREEATQEGFQRGRETERLSEGRTATDWHEIAVACRNHRTLKGDHEKQFVDDMVARTQFSFFEPTVKQAKWLANIFTRAKV